MSYFLYVCLVSLATLSTIKAAPPISSLKESTYLHNKIVKLPPSNQFFTGRKQEIEKLVQAFFCENKNILVIEGISGIGKTQLAKEYAYLYKAKYETIWWFDVEGGIETQIDHFLKEISLRKNQPYYRPTTSDNLFQKLRNELNELKANSLIIFDNIDDAALILKLIALKSDDIFAKHVIVTSKQMNKIFPSVTMNKFQRDESLDFLSRNLAETSRVELNLLAEALGDFPLALVQAAGYIKMNPSINVKTYIQLFKENYAELWSSEKKIIEGRNTNEILADSYNKTISTAIKINIDFVKNKSPLAYKILCFCALLNHHHIPVDIIEYWTCNKQGASKIEFHEALSLLLNNFLLEKASGSEEKTVSSLLNQHELIQLVTRSFLDLGKQKIILKDASECLLQFLMNFSGTLQDQFKEKEHYYDHMEKLCGLADTYNYAEIKITDLRLALLYVVHFIRYDFNRSAKMIKTFRDLGLINKRLNPLARVWFYCTLVNDQIYEDFSEVEKNYKYALVNLEEIQDIETKNSYLLQLNVDYATSLINFGRLKEAISFCDSSREVLKQLNNRLQKISFFGILGFLHLTYGEYDQCLKDLNASFELISKQKDAEKYIPFLTLIRAHCLFYQGHAQEAYQIIEKIYPDLLEIFVSPECNILVKAQLVKAGCLISLARPEDALKIIRSSLDSYEGSSGFDNDALKGMGYRILGEAFEANGELSKAQEAYLMAEKLYDKILQEKSLDDLSRLYTRLAILGVKQKDEVMVERYLSLHITHFGVAHPRTFEIKHFLEQEGLPLP